MQRGPAVLEDLIGKYSYSRPRFSVFLMDIFASIGLLLVGTGIYGVMAYAVSQQTREIGIRMALGAEQAQVFRAVLGVAVRLIGLGLTGGTLGSFLTNRLVKTKSGPIPPRSICGSYWRALRRLSLWGLQRAMFKRCGDKSATARRAAPRVNELRSSQRIESEKAITFNPGSDPIPQPGRYPLM